MWSCSHWLYDASHSAAESASETRDRATAAFLRLLPASRRGLRPVSSVMFMHTWNRQRCTRVDGQTVRSALSTPPPPSHTTASGGAILDSSDDHAAQVSFLATCHPMTWPSAIAMSTTAFRCRWMPSRCTTSCSDRSNGTGGHRLHISVLTRLRLLAGMRRSAWLSLENSQSRPARRSAAARSYDLVADAPQALSLHRHLVLPALVEPFFFIIPWHLGHRGVFIPPIWHIRTVRTPCAATGPRRFRTHILAGLESGGMRIRNHDTPGSTTPHTRFRTHILANNPIFRAVTAIPHKLSTQIALPASPVREIVTGNEG